MPDRRTNRNDIPRNNPWGFDERLERILMANDENASGKIADLLETARSIAVVGVKDHPSEDAFKVPLYMQQAGYRILPVNPKHTSVLGERCCSNLSEVDQEIDIVNLFRASEHIPAHIDEILALDPAPRAVWMQLGIHHGPSAQRLREAGIDVIQDRCIMVDHRRLLVEGQ